MSSVADGANNFQIGGYIDGTGGRVLGVAPSGSKVRRVTRQDVADGRASRRAYYVDARRELRSEALTAALQVAVVPEADAIVKSAQVFYDFLRGGDYE